MKTGEVLTPFASKQVDVPMEGLRTCYYPKVLDDYDLTEVNPSLNLPPDKIIPEHGLDVVLVIAADAVFNSITTPHIVLWSEVLE